MGETSVAATKNEFRLPRVLEWLLGFVVVLELIAPFVAKSYGVDGPSQLNMIGQFTGLVMQGVLIPRWVPSGAYGFGIGTFYFYPPVAFYLASLVRFVTGSANIEFLYQMTGLLGTVLSFFAARPLLKLLGASRYGTNIGALLYAFAPLRIAEIYSRSSISTHVAYLFVPLVWYGIIGIVRARNESRWKWIVALGVSTAMLALSSVPLTLATAMGIGIAAVIFRRTVNIRLLLDGIAALVIAIGLTAFHFSAVLSAMPYAQLKDLTVVNPEFLVSDLVHGKNMPAVYHVGILYLIWAIVCVVYWRFRNAFTQKEKTVAIIGIAVGSFMALLEIPPLSHPLWGSVEPFKLIQGCWRFYIQFVLMGCILIAIAKSSSMQKAALAISWITIAGAVVPAVLIVFNVHLYSHGNGPGGDPTEYLPVYTISAQKNGWSQIQAHSFDAIAMTTLRPGESIQVNRAHAWKEVDSISFQSVHEVTFHRFYWPFWHLYSHGMEVHVTPDSLGCATAVLRGGTYSAEWLLQRTPLETIGRWISGIAWMSFIIFTGISLVRMRVTTTKSRAA